MTTKEKILIEFIKKCDFKGLAEAFRKSDIEWHEKEWKEFINLIHNSAIEDCLKALPEEEYDWKDDVKKAREGLEKDRRMWGENTDNSEVIAMIENQTYSNGFNSCLKLIKDKLEENLKK